MTKNPNFFDCNMTTIDEIAHYARCFPYSSDNKNDVWASPDFMLKIRKGGIEDHAILMACMMMGLKKTKSMIKYYEIANDMAENSEKYERDGTTTGFTPNSKTTPFPTLFPTTNGETTVSGVTPEKDIIITKMEERVSFPYENRVFVCLGKLKYTRVPHIWVMTVSDDYRDITFWEPKLFPKFELQGRVDDPEKLRNFLNGRYPDYDSVKRGKIIAKVEEESEDEDSTDNIQEKKRDLDEIKLRGINEDSIYEYNEGEDIYKDKQMNEKEHLLDGYAMVAKNDDDNLIKLKRKIKLL